ncbi:hypothetical protein EON64_02470 [archaeon]|nr:MAG: hypothetical protein EON64_02470 [archaeon]
MQRVEWLRGRQASLSYMPLISLAAGQEEQPGGARAVLRAALLQESQQLLVAYRWDEGHVSVALHDPSDHFQCTAVLATLPVLKKEATEGRENKIGWMSKLLGSVQARRDLYAPLLGLACSPDER